MEKYISKAKAAPDVLKLFDSEMYKQLIPMSSPSDDRKEPKLLIDHVDNAYYFFASEEQSILVVLERDFYPTFNGKFQVLKTSLKKLQSIAAIRVNNTSTKLAIVTVTRVYVMDLPEKTGGGYFSSGTPSILCKGCYVWVVPEERVKRVRWLYNFLIVFYDRKVDIYDCGEELKPLLVQSWPAENVVDFEIILPVKDKRFCDPESANCIIFLFLKKNGDVYARNMFMRGEGLEAYFDDMNHDATVTKRPPAEDDDGAESCSILVLEGCPRQVAIATTTGFISNYAFTPDTKHSNYQSFRQMLMKTKPKETPTHHILYKLSSVELDLGGIKFSNVEEDASGDDYPSRILLLPDSTSIHRYFALSKAGIHSVTLPIILDLFEYTQALVTQDSELDTKQEKYMCTVDYYLITKCNLLNTAHAPIGFACVDGRFPILIMMLRNSIKSCYLRFWSRRLDLDGYVRADTVQFETQLLNILAECTATPYVDIEGGDSLPAMRRLELFEMARGHHRTSTMSALEKCADLVKCSKETSEKIRKDHLENLERLRNIKKETQSKAEQLAEKCEEYKETHLKLIKRLESYMLVINSLDPNRSSENILLRELRKDSDVVEDLKKRFATFKARAEMYLSVRKHFLERQAASSSQVSSLFQGESLEGIRNQLADMTFQIGQTIDDLKETERELQKK